MREIIQNKKMNKIIIFCLIISITLLSLNIYNQKKERDAVKEYLKENLATEEFSMFKGKWRITEYIDGAVEYSGVDTDTEEYRALNKKQTEEIIEKYLGQELIVDEDNVIFFGPGSELGYYFADFSDLFFNYRQPPIELSSPFVCASIEIEKYKNVFLDIILDKNNEAVLSANGHFFKIKKIH